MGGTGTQPTKSISRAVRHTALIKEEQSTQLSIVEEQGTQPSIVERQGTQPSIVERQGTQHLEALNRHRCTSWFFPALAIPEQQKDPDKKDSSCCLLPFPLAPVSFFSKAWNITVFGQGVHSQQGTGAADRLYHCLQALDLKMFLLGGMVAGGSMVDVFSIGGMIDQVRKPTMHECLYLCPQYGNASSI